MRKYIFAAALSVMVLAVGCSSDSADISIGPADETTVVVTTAAAAEKEESGEGKMDESDNEAEESLKAREEELNSLEESLKAAEESLTEVEESLQEAMSSEEETAEETSEEEATTVAYEALIESAAEYKDTEVTYTGRVIQAVALDDDTMQLLIAVDNDDSTRLVGEYAKDVFSDALAHGDTVTVKGTFVGVNRYMTGDGERVELPSIEISEITVDSTAETEPETEIPATEPGTVPATTAAQETETVSEAAAETPHVIQGPVTN